MTILTHCPSCRRLARVPHDAAGRTVRCTCCQATFVLPPGTGELVIEWGPTGAGRRFPLSPDQSVTIGRTEQSTISLPGPLVSRDHATLDWVDSEWRLRDPGSTNGTFVNGQRVNDIGLTDGSRIILGDFALRLAVATSGPTHLEEALDALAVEESKSGIRPLVDQRPTRHGPVVRPGDTTYGAVPLEAPEEKGETTPLPGAPGLLRRRPVVVAIAAFVIVVVALLVTLAIRQGRL
jgi:LSD1 subclass zinc finger protein